MFCDHQNLVTILDSSGKQVENKATISRLYRWGVTLSEFNYTIQHVPGQYNVFADLLTRWGMTSVGVKLAIRGREVVNAVVLTVKDKYTDFINDRSRFEVSSFDECKWNDDLHEYELLVSWKGLERPTWEPVETTVEDLKDAVKKYLSTQIWDEVAEAILEKYYSA